MQHTESKRIMIGTYPDLYFLAMPGFCWSKHGIQHIINQEQLESLYSIFNAKQKVLKEKEDVT